MMKKRFYTIPLVCAALLFGCSEMFEDRVDMQLGSTSGTLSTLLSSSKDIEKLDAPLAIYVTQGQYADKIVINWEKVPGATSYSLERAVSEKQENGQWVLPDESEYDFMEHSKYIYGTSYTDTIIDDSASNPLEYNNEAYGRAFFYRVTAENLTKGYESSDSCPITDPGTKEKPNKKYNENKVRGTLGTLLAPPANVKADCGEDTKAINIVWTKAAGDIAGYEIYRSASSDGSASVRIGKVTGNENKFLNQVTSEEQGIKYYFSIKSVAKNGQKSASSSIAMGYALKPGAPTRVSGVTVANGRGNTKDKITITWNAAGGVEKGKTICYNIYRSTSTDSTLRKLNSGDSSDLTFEDGVSLKPNVFYYYQIEPYTKEDNFSGPLSKSDSASDTPAEGYILGAPKTINVLKIDGDTAHNRISFSAALGSADCLDNSDNMKKVADYNTYSYVIKYAETATGVFTDMLTVTSPELSSPGYYTVTVDAHKFYKIKTINNGIESDDSPAIAASPNAATDLSVSKNKAIDGYTTDDSKANANGVHAVTLSWTAPVGGADGGYNIYRSTKPDSGFRKVNESAIIDTSYTFVDSSAKAGNYYYYRVLSLNSLGQGANYSNTDYGYGALTTYQYLREYIKTTLNSQKKLTLMHKSGNMEKLGSESANGAISGTLSYEAKVSGVSGRVIMHYTNYADYYIMNDKSLGVYFLLDGNTNTSAGMDTNGTMDGTVTVQGMYPGSVVYDGIKIKGGAAGGGTYGVTRKGIDNSAIQADWTWGEK